MTYISMNSRHMSHASAQPAQTNCSCACTTSMHSARAMLMTMDARIMASIIIFLVLGLVILAGLTRIAVVSVLVSVILALVTVYLSVSAARSNA